MSQKKQAAAPKEVKAETIPDLDSPAVQPAPEPQAEEAKTGEQPKAESGSQLPDLGSPGMQPAPEPQAEETKTANGGKQKQKSGPPYFGNKDEDRRFPLSYNPGRNVVVRMADVSKVGGKVAEVENSARIQVFEPSIYRHLKEIGTFKGKSVMVLNE